MSAKVGTVEFRILGTLEVRRDDGSLATIAGQRQRKVLATLLLDANRPVSVGRLIDAVWDGASPATAPQQVQNAISALRRVLGTAIVAARPGYRIAATDNQVDLLRFDHLVTSASQFTDTEHTRTVATLRAALTLWRGHALAGLTGRALEAAARHLDERWSRTAEQYYELELRRGRHAEVVADLSAVALDRPLHEWPVRSLMVALHRCGRQGDALEVYQRFRRHLAEELGLDPSRNLRLLHRAILRDDPGCATLPGPNARTPAGPLKPEQIPAGVGTFTGRQADLLALDAAVSSGGSRANGAALPVVAVVGDAGVGKSALAISWAHRVTKHFPDGQIYVDLHGHSAAPAVTPVDALRQILRSLGTPPAWIPIEAGEQAALLRTLVARRRVLFLLDNAAGPAQIRPLLPGSPTCLTIVTSRGDLSGLITSHDIRQWELGPLQPDEVTELLGALIGVERVRAEPEAAAELGSLCAALPLALRIVGARLAGRRHLTLGAVVCQLRRDRDLAVLVPSDDPDLAFRARSLAPHAGVDPDQCLLF